MNTHGSIAWMADLIREGACDMHLHTDASDGTDSAAILVQKVIESSLRCFSITDHDTVIGVKEALRIQDELGRLGLSTPRFIPGIELSAEEDGEVHLLGYFPHGGYDEMETYLTIQQQRRYARNKRMCELLTRKGMPIGVEELKTGTSGVAGKLHMANLMIRKGYVDSVKQAFEQWLGAGRPCYVQREKPSARQGIRAITDAGGIAVLAHPFLYGWCSNTPVVSAILIQKLEKLKKYGLAGVEAFHGEATETQCLETRAAALTTGLVSTVGSDYHGSNKKGIRMISAQDRFIRDNERLRAVFICEEGGKLLMVRGQSGFSEQWMFPGYLLEESQFLQSDPAAILARRLGVETKRIRHHSTQVFAEKFPYAPNPDSREAQVLISAAYRLPAEHAKLMAELFGGTERTGWFRFAELSELSLSRCDGALFDRLREIPLCL